MISVEQTKVGVRQNAAVEQLTILATVFLPLTFVTGFFDQNFEWLHTSAGPCSTKADQNPRYAWAGRRWPQISLLNSP